MSEYGIYTAPERVERDGVLVCFAGERMTKAEAARRGLLAGTAEEAPAKEPEGAPAEEAPAKEPEGAPDEGADGLKEALMAKTAKELEELAQAIGAEHPKGAVKEKLAEVIISSGWTGDEGGER